MKTRSGARRPAPPRASDVPDVPGADPFAPWRELVAVWEKNVNALANRTMASDEFTSTMHGTTGLTVKAQEALRDVMAAYLASVNLPSRNDVAALGERIGQLESRLDRIAAALERIAGTAARADDTTTAEAPARRPPRTKRPAELEPPA